MHDDRRTNHAGGLSKHAHRKVVLVLFLKEDALLQTGKATTAKFDWPRKTSPTVLGFGALPITTGLHMRVLVFGKRAHHISWSTCSLHR